MDRFLAMSVFAKVAEQKSFSKAAQYLDISTSAASRLVADLETHLDTRLLNRTTRRISLTESGQAFFQHCTQLLADLAAAEHAASTVTTALKGKIKLTCSGTFGVLYIAPAMGDFLIKYPQVSLDMVLGDEQFDLVEQGFDLAIRISDLKDSNLIARKLGEIRQIVCASPDYLARHGTPKKPEDLIQHNCLVPTQSKMLDKWYFHDKNGRELTVTVSGTMQANRGDFLVEAAVCGVGVVYEPSLIVAAAIKTGQLVPLLEHFQSPTKPIYAVYPSRRHLSAKVRTLINFLAERFSTIRFDK